MPRPRTGAIVACSECGKERYVSPSQVPRYRYCSSVCQAIAVEKRQRTQCVRCGSPFSQSPSVGGKYCGWTCYQADRQKRTTCAACGRDLRKDQLTYCSKACMAEGRRTLEERPCEACGKPMRVQPHQFGKRRACSKACNDELKRLQGPGARFLRKDGYIAVYYPKHPDATKDGRVMEHRLVMERVLGRRLLKTEHVNHINHIKTDNRPENLEILSPGDHMRETVAWAKARRRTMRDRLAEYERRFGPLPTEEP